MTKETKERYPGDAPGAWPRGALIFLVALLFPTPLHAHELPQERSILVELTEDTVEAMVVYQEPPGDRIGLLKTRFDFDGDGHLNGAEAAAAADTWIPHALQGLKFEIPGADARREVANIKFEDHHNGALSVAILLSWELDPLNADALRRVRLRRTSQGGDFATIVHFQAPDALQFVSTPAARTKTKDLEGGQKVGPYRLEQGKLMRVKVKLTGGDDSTSPNARPDK